MNYCIKISTVIYILFSGLCIHAQQSNPTTGGKASGEGGSTSYTVGQVVYSDHTGTSGTITEGVQQPYEILIVTSIEGTKEILLESSVYPNPTNDYLILNINNYEFENLSYWLYGIKGILIKTEKVNSIVTQISMDNQGSGIYLLKIFDKNKEIKTFKIIKN